MFNKAQFFIGVTIAAIIGFGVGYSKSREKCLEAMIKATSSKNNEDETEHTTSD